MILTSESPSTSSPQSTLTRLAPTQVELEITITPDELAIAEERAFRKLSKNVRIAGFRPGKVPRKVFEQNYGRETLETQAMEDAVPELYAKAIREHALDPVDRPSMELLPEEPGQPKRIKATVEVRPEIILREYKGLPLVRSSSAVSDEDVERSLASLAKERATLVPVDRAANLGDVVTIDYEGKIDDVPFEGGTAKEQVTELREDRFIPGFASGIAGMKSGETKDVEATFPEGYQQAELAGKNAVFTIALHDVKELESPALDDEFAKTISENATIDELRADIRRRLEAVATSRVRRELGNQVMERLIEIHDVPLPASMVEREIDTMLNDLASSAARNGLAVDDYLKAIGKTEADLRADFRKDAETRVKGTLLVEAIAKAENVEAQPADLQNELRALSEQYGQPVDRIRTALGGNLHSVVEGIVRTKTVDFLVDNASVSDAPAPEKKPATPKAAPKKKASATHSS